MLPQKGSQRILEIAIHVVVWLTWWRGIGGFSIRKWGTWTICQSIAWDSLGLWAHFNVNNTKITFGYFYVSCWCNLLHLRSLFPSIFFSCQLNFISLIKLILFHCHTMVLFPFLLFFFLYFYSYFFYCYCFRFLDSPTKLSKEQECSIAIWFSNWMFTIQATMSHHLN